MSFIEITTLHGEPALINLNSVVEISCRNYFDLHSQKLYTGTTLVVFSNGHSVPVKGDYETIKRAIMPQKRIDK